MQKPSVVFLQETKLGRPGRIKTPSSSIYTWYELHRTKNATKGQNGGGLALGVVNHLEPSWISEGNDNTEAITVEIWAKGFPICLVCGYGPQEHDPKDRKSGFWEYIENEVHNASQNGAGIIIPMDWNLWAEDHIITGDPNKQYQNGKLLDEFLNRNRNISVLNALAICKWKITHERNTLIGTQKSILDFFLVCDKILPHVTEMEIYENGENSLTRYRGETVVKTDHNMMKCEVNLNFHIKKIHEKI